MTRLRVRLLRANQARFSSKCLSYCEVVTASWSLDKPHQSQVKCIFALVIVCLDSASSGDKIMSKENANYYSTSASAANERTGALTLTWWRGQQAREGSPWVVTSKSMDFINELVYQEGTDHRSEGQGRERISVWQGHGI